MLGGGVALDQPRVVQRQVAAQLGVQDGAQVAAVDPAVVADGFAQALRIDHGVVAAPRQVDGAGGEVDGEGDQSGDHEEQDADAVEHGDRRVDPPADLSASFGVEQGAAGAELGEQRGGETGTDDSRIQAHVVFLIVMA